MPANEQPKAVIYARYSSHGQTEQSIEGQLHDNYEFAAREGYKVIGEYIDRAMTGRNDRRSDFQRMIEDAAKKQFQYIIVWKLDRFARNRYDSAIYKARLKKYGVRVISAKENISDNPEGIILEGMLESMAEYYSANLSVNVKRGQRETLAKGRYCGGQIPYGYKIVDGKLVADERTAPVIRYVFEQYAQGVPKKQIVRTLNARGVKSASGGEITITTFQHALINPTYMGKLIRSGQEIPGCAEALVSEELFNRVQERVAENRRAPAASKATVEYLLQGKAFCGHCGSRMVGESGRGRHGTVYHYYACAEKKKHHTCDKKNEKKDFVEWYVVEQTLQYVLAPGTREKIAKAVVDAYDQEFSSSKVAGLEREISRTEADLNKLVDALIEAPKSAHARIYTKMEALEAQKEDLETNLAKLRVAQRIRYTEAEVLVWMKKFCDGDPMDLDFRRKVIDVFINSVYLYDNRIIIFYNIRGGKQISYIDLAKSYPASKENGSDLNESVLPMKEAACIHRLLLFFAKNSQVWRH